MYQSFKVGSIIILIFLCLVSVNWIVGSNDIPRMNWEPDRNDSPDRESQDENPMVHVEIQPQCSTEFDSPGFTAEFTALIYCDKSTPRDCITNLVFNVTGGPADTDYRADPSRIYFSGRGQSYEYVTLLIRIESPPDGLHVNWTLDGTYYLEGSENQLYSLEEKEGTVIFLNSYRSEEDINRSVADSGPAADGGSYWPLILISTGTFLLTTFCIISLVIMIRRRKRG